MSGIEKLILTVSIVVVGIAIGAVIQRMVATKRIANWFGSGVHEGLHPHQAAVLLGIHPSVIVAILFAELEGLGKARAIGEPHEPCRGEWLGGRPGGAVEKAARDALNEDGTFREEGVFDLLEAIYEEVNEEMLNWSGRETAVHYRELAEELWSEGPAVLAQEPRASGLFLLHRDPGLLWDELGDDPVSRRFKETFRLGERFHEMLVPSAAYRERALQATAGFFRYRRDLRSGPEGRLAARPPLRYYDIDPLDEE